MPKYYVNHTGRDVYCYYPPSKCRIWRDSKLLSEVSTEFPLDAKGIISSGIDDDGVAYILKLGERVDYYKAFPLGEPYIIQATGSGHFVLFYQNKDGDVGYREVTEKRTGPFHRFHNFKSGNIYDASFLTTFDELHVLMIVRSPFSYQLLYRKKTEDVFTPPVQLWEAPKIEHCLLTLIGNELHATCMIGGRPHRVISIDEGDSFGQMELYKRKFCAEPIKANFTSQQVTDGWLARQVYVDKNAPWDVQMLPDIVDFF